MENIFLNQIQYYRGKKCVVVETDLQGRPTLLMGIEELTTRDLDPDHRENWFDAIEIDRMLQKNGLGWRLPSRDTLKRLQKFISEYGLNGLPNKLYQRWIWSTTEVEGSELRAWTLDLGNNSFYRDEKTTKTFQCVVLPFFELKWHN